MFSKLVLRAAIHGTWRKGLKSDNLLSSVSSNCLLLFFNSKVELELGHWKSLLHRSLFSGHWSSLQPKVKFQAGTEVPQWSSAHTKVWCHLSSLAHGFLATCSSTSVVSEVILYLTSSLTCCDPSHTREGDQSWAESYQWWLHHWFPGAGSAYISLLLHTSQGLLYFNWQLQTWYHCSLQDMDFTFGKDKCRFYRKTNGKFVFRNLARKISLIRGLDCDQRTDLTAKRKTELGLEVPGV